MNVSELRNEGVKIIAEEFIDLLTKIINYGKLDEYKNPVKVSRIDERIGIEISLFTNKDGIYCARDDFFDLINRFLEVREFVLIENKFENVVNLMEYDNKKCIEMFSNIKTCLVDEKRMFSKIEINEPNENLSIKNDRIDFYSDLSHIKDSKTSLSTPKSYFVDPLSKIPKSITEIRPFVCKYKNCCSAFKRLEHLKRHNRIHTGERPFKCQFPGCYKKFARSDNLTQHLKTHNLRVSNRRTRI